MELLSVSWAGWVIRVESEDHPSVSGLRVLPGVIVDIQTD
jgi:hypothetical protein